MTSRGETAAHESCLDSETLSLSLSPDATRLTAVITDIRCINDNGEPVPTPPYEGSAAVGDTSYFEFAAPHLLKETSVSQDGSDNYGNPYWCGEGLEPDLHYHCGA